MNNRNRNRSAAGAVLLTAQLLSGCTGTSPKVDFYTLTADNDMTGFPGAAQRCRSTPIDIGPISWPRYLDQPRIVTRASPNRLELDEFHRWGGSLQDDFQRVLIKDLSGLLQSERVGNFERTSRFKPDYRVVLEVRQFDGQLGGEVILDVRWGIIRHASGEVLVVKNSQLQEASPEPTHDALVNASSRAVAGLAREIAAALAGLCPAG